MKKINFILVLLLFTSTSCGLLEDTEDALTGEELEDQSMCAAMDAGTTDEFEDNSFEGTFDQALNETSQFISISDSVEADLDDNNVMVLNSAAINFDFEDSSVDSFGLGGFLSRWKAIIVAYDETLSSQIDTAIDGDDDDQQDMIDDLLDLDEAVEVQISGPFDGNGCEWGDTQSLGTQALTYSNYPIYDWDYFPLTTRVLVVVYEGDDGIHDDLILKMDIAQDDEQTTFTDDSDNEFVITPDTDI